MEANLIQIVFTLIVVGIIGAIKFYEKKYGTNPEAWDTKQFGFLIVVAVVIMGIEFQFGNEITFPAEDVIIPAMALFGMAYTIITGGKLATSVTKQVVASTGTGGVVSPAWSPGFTIVPVEQLGVSPFTAMFTITVGRDPSGNQCKVQVDWQDGTPVQEFHPNPRNQIMVTHTFTYLKGDSQYTGHQFYPVFRVIGPTGVVYGEFNTTNKCCWIEVQSR